MKIYVCDKCGSVKRVLNGIVGTEFELHGYSTLHERFRTDDIVDLCGKCMKAADKALETAKSHRLKLEEDAVNRALKL